MSQKWSLLGASLCLVFALDAFAYYCSTPQGNGYINIGDSTDTVAQACGASPTVSESQNVGGPIQSVQYWIYQNNQVQNNPFNLYKPNHPQTTVNQFAPPAIVEVTNGYVTSITSGKNSVDQTNCAQGSGIVRIGDSTNQLLQSCSQPSSISYKEDNPQTNPDAQPVITTWTYDFGPNLPPLVLEFQNGQLTKINGGQG